MAAISAPAASRCIQPSAARCWKQECQPADSRSALVPLGQNQRNKQPQRAGVPQALLRRSRQAHLHTFIPRFSPPLAWCGVIHLTLQQFWCPDIKLNESFCTLRRFKNKTKQKKNPLNYFILLHVLLFYVLDLNIKPFK